MVCPDCATEVPEDDLFCENCGRKLHGEPALPACVCGAREVDEDGFCLRCGRLLRRPASDHVEVTLSPGCAGVSDRGLRHDRNEDRLGMAQAGGGWALVVCDGVSATSESEVASSAVAEGVLAVLVKALESGEVGDTEGLMRRAVAAGEAELLRRGTASDNPPSTTVVAALVVAGEATVGWVGDSRAYWIDAAGATALTRDHSWVNAVTAAGELTLEEAERAPQAHAITRWIGADAMEGHAEVDVVRLPVGSPGILLLCTDGLWNYAATPEEMAAVVGAACAAGDDALTMARHLIAFANGCGGRDNITVALLRCGELEIGR